MNAAPVRKKLYSTNIYMSCTNYTTPNMINDSNRLLVASEKQERNGLPGQNPQSLA